MDADDYPLLPWIGGSSADMTPYKCFLGCLKIDMVEKATPLTIGVSGEICFCGHTFDTESKFLYKCFLLINFLIIYSTYNPHN